MSLNTLNELQQQATALRKTSETLEGYAKTVSRIREAAIHAVFQKGNQMDGPFHVRAACPDYHPIQTKAIETEFQKAIAPFEDHILAIMEINFRTEAKKAMMRAEATEARIAAAITLPEPLP